MRTFARSVRAFAALVLPLVAAAACSSAPPVDERVGTQASAVINGQLDSTHPAVVMLYAQSGDGAGLCSGTIVKVSGNVGWVATAAHCVEIPPAIVIQGQDFLGDDRLQYEVLDYAADSRYSSTGSGYDFAVVRIAGVDASTPVIPLTGSPDGLASNTQVLSVGYGKTQLNQAPNDPNQNSRRYSVTKRLFTPQTTLIGYDMATSGICQGDSGGPVLVGSPPNERVVGIHSFVRGTRNADCNGEGYSSRVTSGTTFFNQQLAKAPPPNDCAFCEKVANSGNGECVSMTKDCLSDAQCKGYYDCVSSCTSINCRIDCVTKYPKAQGPIAALSACVCARACTDKCGSQQQCAGVPKCGYKLPAGDCSTCTEGSCCNETFDCTRDGTCYLCLKNKDADAACATNAARKALATCVARTCKTECADTGLDVGADPAVEEEGAAGGKKVVTTTEGCSSAPARGSSPFSIAVFGVALAFAVSRRRR